MGSGIGGRNATHDASISGGGTEFGGATGFGGDGGSANGGTSPTGGASNGGTAGTGNGGAIGAGGITANGGAIGAGGITANGGAIGAGGVTANGGAIGAGGLTANGGATGTGGVTANGGAIGAGGSGTCVVTNGGVEICDGIDNDCSGTPDDAAACASGCTGYSYNGHAYAFCTTPMSYADAGASCQAQGMRLVRVDDSAENDFVFTTAFAGVAQSNNSNTLWPWLGAYDTATPLQWQWPDGAVFWSGRLNGSPVGGLYSAWDASSPSDTSGTYGAVIEHNTSRLWHERDGTSLQPYFCERY
jgi:hypothetical protein